MTRLDAIKARLRAATPGPWEYETGGDSFFPAFEFGTEKLVLGKVYCDDLPGMADNAQDNARLIAHAPDDLAWLITQLAQAQARIEKLEQALKAQRVGSCFCYAQDEPGASHSSSCELASAALDAEKGSGK